jgi:Holliday junction resolvase RusA-like endonuclease
LHRIRIKPLSSNRAWQGRRFKTPAYKAFEKELWLKLPPKVLVPDGPIKITFIFHLSNLAADGDNCIKQAQDVIAKKYGFNDSRISHWEVHKCKAAKGEESISFRIEAASLFLVVPGLVIPTKLQTD